MVAWQVFLYTYKMLILKNSKSIAILVILFSFTALSSLNGLTLLKKKSHIKFIANSRFVKANGNFHKFELETAKVIKNKLMATLKVSIDSIDTNNSGRDKHLKGKDFFDYKKYPFARIKVSNIDLSKGKQQVLATVSIKGVSIKMSFLIHLGYQKAKETIFSIWGKTSIDRTHFGIDFDSTINPIDNNIDISFNFAIKK